MEESESEKGKYNPFQLWLPKKVIVSFDFADGLHFSNSISNQFEIAGADGIFYEAVASIKNNNVVLQSDKVKNPVKVRYFWK